MLRRSVGVTVLFLSAVGIVACPAGIVGIWMVRQTAAEKVNTISARLDVGLQRASVANQNVKHALEKASADVGRVRHESADLGGGDEKPRHATRALQRFLRQEAGPRMNNLGGRLATCSETAVAVSSLLHSFQELPLAQTGRITPDKLEGLTGQVAQLSAALQRLQTVLGDGDMAADEKEVAAASREVELVLQKCQATVDDWQSDLDAVGEQLPHIKGKALAWLRLVAIGVSVLCVWVGVSQISLFAHARKWCRA
jgi:hypothetical protein